MKNTQLVMMFVIISMVGIHSRASAQILPVNGATLVNNHVVTVSEVQAAPVAVHANPVVLTTAPIAAVVAPVVQVQHPPIDVTSIQVAPASTIATTINPAVLGAPVHVASQGINTTAIAHIDPGLAYADPGTGSPSNTGGTSGSGQNNGGSSGSSGSGGSSGGNTVGRYPVITVAPAAPVVTSARPAVYTESYNYKTTPKQVVEKQMIPLLPEDSVSDYTYSDTNNMSASVQGISGQMTLVGILAGIAAVLGLMVAVKEYNIRKQMKQHAQYA